MISALLDTPAGWLLIFGLVVAVAWMAAGISEILNDPPKWFPMLVASVLIAYSLVRAPDRSRKPVRRGAIRRKD